MYLTRTSILFQALDRTGSPTPYLDGNIGDRYSATWVGYFQKGTTNGQTGFNKVLLQLLGGVITAIPNGDQAPTENFINDGLQIGETIRLTTGANTGTTFTITRVTATTLTVTGTMVPETTTSNIWVTNLITSFDYLYNLLPNGSQPSFNSLTDSGVQQKYTISSSTGNFTIGTASKAWVTDTLTGNVSEATITAGSITSDFKQLFTIVHNFFITPLSTGLRNFTQETPPAIYPLTYCYGVNGYYTTPPVLNCSITETIANGLACWADQNNSGTVPEFYINETSYIDNATGLILTSMDFTEKNLVTIKIKSVSGLFAGGTKLILQHLYIPLSKADYQNTPTTLRQNFMYERAISTIGAGAVNGEFYGTNYSIWQDVVMTLVDSHNCTITAKAIYAASLQAFFKSKAGNNRNYSLLISAQA